MEHDEDRLDSNAVELNTDYVSLDTTLDGGIPVDHRALPSYNHYRYRAILLWKEWREPFVLVRT